MNVNFKVLNENFALPQRGSEHAACFDCFATSMVYKGNGVWCYGLGFSTEFSEPNWKGIIVPRSSLTKTKYVMQNSPGQVDEDYRGEWMVKFRYVSDYKNLVTKPLPPYQIGERICQIYFEKVNPVSFKVVEELSETNRGSGGFGSSGK